MAMSTESRINANAATAILLRLNAFHVRCDGVNSAKLIVADQFAKYRFFWGYWQLLCLKKTSKSQLSKLYR
jgi:hypothetical protein